MWACAREPPTHLTQRCPSNFAVRWQRSVISTEVAVARVLFVLAAVGVKPLALQRLDRSLQTLPRVEPTSAPKQSRTWLQWVACAAAMLSGFGAWCNSASAEEIVPPSAAQQPCAASVRLRAVQYDPNNDQRSFATFAGAPRSQLRRGARVSGYAIERIEQGAVVLASQTQRCTVRLRGAVASRELRAIAVEDVRSAMRARSPLVTSVSKEPGKLGI